MAVPKKKVFKKYRKFRSFAHFFVNTPNTIPQPSKQTDWVKKTFTNNEIIKIF